MTWLWEVDDRGSVPQGPVAATALALNGEVMTRGRASIARQMMVSASSFFNGILLLEAGRGRSQCPQNRDLQNRVTNDSPPGCQPFTIG
jgi:hypothetical protein